MTDETAQDLRSALTSLRAHCNREIARLNGHATAANGWKPAPDLHATNAWLKRLDSIWRAMDAQPTVPRYVKEFLAAVWSASGNNLKDMDFYGGWYFHGGNPDVPRPPASWNVADKNGWVETLGSYKWKLTKAGEDALFGSVANQPIGDVAAMREAAANACDRVANESVLVSSDPDARIRHEGIVSGARYCSAAIRALPIPSAQEVEEKAAGVHPCMSKGDAYWSDSPAAHADALSLLKDMLPLVEPARLREEAAALEGSVQRMPVRQIVRRAKAALSTPPAALGEGEGK